MPLQPPAPERKPEHSASIQHHRLQNGLDRSQTYIVVKEVEIGVLVHVSRRPDKPKDNRNVVLRIDFVETLIRTRETHLLGVGAFRLSPPLSVAESSISSSSLSCLPLPATSQKQAYRNINEPPKIRDKARPPYRADASSRRNHRSRRTPTTWDLACDVCGPACSPVSIATYRHVLISRQRWESQTESTTYRQTNEVLLFERVALLKAFIFEAKRSQESTEERVLTKSFRKIPGF